MLRPGRFDRTIEISLPGLKEREEILKVHLGNIKLDDEPEKYAGRIAHNTPGMSGELRLKLKKIRQYIIIK